MVVNAKEITQLLQAHKRGERAALDELMALVYDKLHAIASKQLNRGARRATLSPTVLVHDAFLILQRRRLNAESRAHFYSIVAKCMRWLILGYARQQRAAKRGGVNIRLPFDEALHSPEMVDHSLDSLSAALDKLSKLDPELSHVVELRYLVGLSIEETAETLNVSINTVKRRWQTAKLWLTAELKRSMEKRGLAPLTIQLAEPCGSGLRIITLVASTRL